MIQDVVIKTDKPVKPGEQLYTEDDIKAAKMEVLEEVQALYFGRYTGERASADVYAEILHELKQQIEGEQ